jgi:hypothetical protein
VECSLNDNQKSTIEDHIKNLTDPNTPLPDLGFSKSCQTYEPELIQNLVSKEVDKVIDEINREILERRYNQEKEEYERQKAEFLEQERQSEQETQSCDWNWNVFDSNNCVNQTVRNGVSYVAGFVYEAGNNYLWDIPNKLFGEYIDLIDDFYFNSGRDTGYIFNLTQALTAGNVGKTVQDFGNQAKGFLAFGGGVVGGVIGGVTATGGCLFGATVATIGSLGVGAVSYVCVVPAWAGGTAVGAGAGALIGGGTGLSLELGGSILNSIADSNYSDLVGGSGRLTGPQATSKAAELGYEKTKDISNGQPVYKKIDKKKPGPKYISPDADTHNGGVWKGADSPDEFGPKDRTGTYNGNLEWIKK